MELCWRPFIAISVEDLRLRGGARCYHKRRRSTPKSHSHAVPHAPKTHAKERYHKAVVEVNGVEVVVKVTI